jgi:hypothetical protein
MKKKNKYHLILFLFAIVFLLTGCNDMLDLKPETDPSDEVMWTSPGAFEKGANTFYGWLPKLYSYMSKAEMGDEIIIWDAVNTTSNSTYSTVPTDGTYTDYFEHVRAINYLFKNAETYPRQDEIKQYVAEAHFFRAFYSFLVFVDYGPLTIVKEVAETSSPELYAPRASRDEFADFIISDLETAINSNALPKQADIQATNQNGRITIGAVWALLAKVCLFEGTWQKYHYNNTSRSNALLQKAAQYAEQVMNDNSYRLFHEEAMGEYSYRYMFILESVTKCNYWGINKDRNFEYVFRNRFNETVRQSGQQNTHKGNSIPITRKLVELFLDRDGNATLPDYKTSLSSYTDNRDPRLSTTSNPMGVLYWYYEPGSTFTRDHADSLRMNIRTYWRTTGFYVNKYSGLRPANSNADGFDTPIIRLGEVYLIYAEAKCELNETLTQDELDESINKLRERVHMPFLTPATIPAGSSMLAEIRRERTIEMYLEGLRYDDLRRWKTAETELSGNLEGVWMGEGSAFARDWSFDYPLLGKSYTYLASENKAFPVSEDGYAIRELASFRKFDQKYYLRPLPTKEIELNPALVQNPDW